MSFHEHHYRNLQRARDHLTETIVCLRSALDQMTGDDWIDASQLLQEIIDDVAPRLGRLRTAASVRFDEHTRLDDFEAMRTGLVPFPDERVLALDLPADAEPAVKTADVPSLNAPNAKLGAALVAQHGGVDEAMKAYPPDSPEFDHIQAYRYVSSGRRPRGWIPPIVSDELSG